MITSVGKRIMRNVMTRDEVRHYEGVCDEEACVMNHTPADRCKACGDPIRIQIRRGTGYCCALCEEAPF